MDLGAGTRLIIYLQPWSESMALALSISWISPVPLKLSFLSSSKIVMKIVGYEKNLFWELVPCVEVTFVSKFYSICYTIPQESNLGRNGRILGENHVFQRHPTGQCSTPPDNV
jgi:hypothetical protein